MPLPPPIQERSRRPYRIDHEGTVVEARQVVALGQALAVRRHVFGGMRRHRRNAKVALQQPQHPARANRGLAHGGLGTEIETVRVQAESHMHGRAS